LTPGTDHINRQAVTLLRSLITKEGILASAIESDNYKRIWARDSILSGIAGLMLGDQMIIDGLKQSLITLANHQHELGMIPSNVQPDTSQVSYGSLAGRIDASTWYLVGCALYYMESRDEDFFEEASPTITNTLSFLSRTEFNAGGWIYTPLSGNWADEYPVHGFTLYDNCLYLWALSLLDKIGFLRFEDRGKAYERMRTNFWPRTAGEQSIYHKAGYETAKRSHPKHFASFLLPGYYDLRFDAAGNALAMLVLGMDKDQQQEISSQMDLLKAELHKTVIPAFWPVIDQQHPDWKLLANNYSYAFKNEAGHFHNGGIWPIWQGLFGLGLMANGLHTEAKALFETYMELIRLQPSWDFDEYHYAYDLLASGKKKMAYTASGIVFMHLAQDRAKVALKKLHLSQ